MTEHALLDRFTREYIDYHQISADRAKEQRKVLLAFEATLDGRPLTEATSEELQAFAGRLLSSGLHVNTVRKRLNMIRPFYSWAYAAKLITADLYLELKSVRNPRGSTGATKPDPYKRAEMSRFWEELAEAFPLIPAKGKRSLALKQWLRGRGPWRNVWRHAMRLQIEAMVKLALHCGLRRQEIYNLALDDLHYDNEYIVIRGKADPNTGMARARSVPFTGEVREAVYTWLEFRAMLRPEHERPWLCLYGSRTFRQPMRWERFETLLQDTVGPGWRWHRFRHTCATEWLRAGAELEYVQRLLGHATIQQTLCYAEILKSDIARHLGKHEAAFTEAVTNRAA